MIIESRSIIFSNEELILALAAQLENAPAGETATTVKPLLNDQGDIEARITLSGGSVLPVEHKDLAISVLNHCIERGIPLPRGSYKELAIRGEYVALIVRLENKGGLSDDDMDFEEY